MQIAVITVQREPMYLHNTLCSLAASTVPDDLGPVDVFIGTPEFVDVSGYPETYEHYISRELWRLIEPLPPKLRAVGNFINALQSGEGDLMLFEDDIKIKPGWINALAAVQLDLPHRFVSLFSHRDLRVCSCNTKKTWADICLKHDLDGSRMVPPAVELLRPIVDFYGTLGLFVPAAHRKPLAEAALVHLQPDDPRPVEQRWPFDEIVKMYINDHRECSLAITIPSYVDHVGEFSIINPTHGPRRAPMF